MLLSARLSVAIYSNNGLYRHWSLYIEGPTRGQEIIFHILGEPTRFRFEMRNSNARQSAMLVELIHLCDVEVSKIGPIKSAAKSATIHNESPGYNCQDFVLELLDELEGRSIIDREDEDYRKQKEILKAKQEGF